MNAWVCAHYAEVLAFASGGGDTVACLEMSQMQPSVRDPQGSVHHPPGPDGSGLVLLQPTDGARAAPATSPIVASPERLLPAVLVLLLGGVGYLIFIAELGRDSEGIDQRPSVNESPRRLPSVFSSQ